MRLEDMIRSWWNERIVEGVQLQHLEDYREGIDYVGKHGWRMYVSIHALNSDFNRRWGQSVGTEQFSTYFSMITRNSQRAQRKVPLETRNRNIAYRMASFVRFDGRPSVPLPI